MTDQLRPSPALAVNDDTSIGETLRVMREHKVGSVLVNSHQTPHGLVGIFTERDLLKWVDEIRKNNSWDKPIASIMSKNLITCPVTEIQKAGELMADHGIRHMPVVYLGEDGQTHVAGVISMRDAFKNLLKEKKEAKIMQQFRDRRTLLLAHGDRERTTQQKLLGDHLDLVLMDETILNQGVPDLMLPTLLSSDLVIFDLDHFPSAFWAPVLKKLLDERKSTQVIVIYDPVLQDVKGVTALKALAKGSVLSVFPKPLNLLEYLRQIQKYLNE